MRKRTVKIDRRRKTIIGVDFGTKSARAILVDTKTGEILNSHKVVYPLPRIIQPEIDLLENLPCAADYENALYELLERVVSKEEKEFVEGICIDATSLTMVLLDSNGKALSETAQFVNEPHARIKLWKYHRAQKWADEALILAQKCEEPFLKRTCGFISCEWILPKLLEIRDEAPKIYQKIDLVLDLCEFLTYCLTGKLIRSTGTMSYKGLWFLDIGFPSRAYLDGLRPGFYEEYRKYLRGEVRKPGESAGFLKAELCDRLGFGSATSVAVGLLDGHTSLAALGAFESGDSSLILGTSNVLTVQCEDAIEVKDACGIARDGMVKGLWGIDAGQSCTGNMLEWFLDHMLDWKIHKEAEQKNQSVHEILSTKIRRPWENQLTAIDWWNGSRNVPCNLKLRGSIKGMGMDTRTEDIYLALLQAIACGTKTIVDSFAAQGIEIHRILATGGIAEKNHLLMQEYANIMNRTIQVGKIEEGPALGAAIYGAVAAGIYKDIPEAYQYMGIKEFITYEPDRVHGSAYEKLYQENLALRQFVSNSPN